MGYPTVKSVREGSTAECLGIRPGDVIVTLNGKRLRDIIDYQFEMAGESIELEVRSASGEVTLFEVEKEYDDLLGLDFTEDLFDGIKACRNKCLFCFVSNLPEGMRASLYLRDDDYRLSFLHGNFVTLTNLDSADIARIRDQRLSPLYVSVHSFCPGIRQRLLGNERAPDIRKVMARLAQHGIKFHCQVVYCPGFNDGPDFEETLDGLSALRPAVLSVGVVPVGLTRYCNIEGLRRPDERECRRLIMRAKAWSEAKGGNGWLFLADEIFIYAGRPVPRRTYYADFPQLENGIGLARLFLDSARRVPSPPAALPRLKQVAVATGNLFYPYMSRFVQRYDAVENLRVHTVLVRNEFFGEMVSVSGLMTGSDLRRSLLGLPAESVLVPSACQNNGRFLDGMTTEELGQSLGIKVEVLPADPVLLDERITSI